MHSWPKEVWPAAAGRCWKKRFWLRPGAVSQVSRTAWDGHRRPWWEKWNRKTMVSSMVSGQLDRFDGKNHGFRCRFSPTNQSIDWFHWKSRCRMLLGFWHDELFSSWPGFSCRIHLDEVPKRRDRPRSRASKLWSSTWKTKRLSVEPMAFAPWPKSFWGGCVWKWAKSG